jgi:hypothetical protein
LYGTTAPHANNGPWDGFDAYISDDLKNLTIHEIVTRIAFAPNSIKKSGKTIINGTTAYWVQFFPNKADEMEEIRPTKKYLFIDKNIGYEIDYYITSPHDTLSQYPSADGGLNINALLKEYRSYVHRRGFRAFDTENLKEAAWHYSLDGFIYFFIDQLGGQTFIEIPSGRGRIDILIRYQNKSYIVETKLFSNITYFKRGKGQLAEYLKSEGLAEGYAEGYYVVFSRFHTAEDELYSAEVIEGKQIYTHLIPINFEPPSRLPVPDELN